MKVVKRVEVRFSRPAALMLPNISEVVSVGFTSMTTSSHGRRAAVHPAAFDLVGDVVVQLAFDAQEHLAAAQGAEVLVGAGLTVHVLEHRVDQDAAADLELDVVVRPLRRALPGGREVDVVVAPLRSAFPSRGDRPARALSRAVRCRLGLVRVLGGARRALAQHVDETEQIARRLDLAIPRPDARDRSRNRRSPAAGRRSSNSAIIWISAARSENGSSLRIDLALYRFVRGGDAYSSSRPSNSLTVASVQLLRRIHSHL